MSGAGVCHRQKRGDMSSLVSVPGHSEGVGFQPDEYNGAGPTPPSSLTTTEKYPYQGDSHLHPSHPGHPDNLHPDHPDHPDNLHYANHPSPTTHEDHANPYAHHYPDHYHAHPDHFAHHNQYEDDFEDEEEEWEEEEEEEEEEHHQPWYHGVSSWWNQGHHPGSQAHLDHHLQQYHLPAHLREDFSHHADPSHHALWAEHEPHHPGHHAHYGYNQYDDEDEGEDWDEEEEDWEEEEEEEEEDYHQPWQHHQLPQSHLYPHHWAGHDHHNPHPDHHYPHHWAASSLIQAKRSGPTKNKKESKADSLPGGPRKPRKKGRRSSMTVVAPSASGCWVNRLIIRKNIHPNHFPTHSAPFESCHI